MNKSCPCHSGKKYNECCEPFHAGALPTNALELMRSRYSAYALNLPNYIIATSSSRVLKDDIVKFSQATYFQKLEILEFQDGEESATVSFRAHLQQGGRDASFTEKSLFEKVNGKWLYKDILDIH